MGDAAQKARIEAMKKQIEQRGGLVGSVTEISDDLLEIFLREVIECPQCACLDDDHGEDGDLDDLDDLDDLRDLGDPLDPFVPFVPGRRRAHDH